MKFTIRKAPRTKKNSNRIVTVKGRPIIIPSKAYKDYERDCMPFMPRGSTIVYPVNIKAVFYMPTRRRCDMTNLMQSLADILVHYGVLEDDNYKIIASWDGSRVRYDKTNSRTEVEITPYEEESEQEEE